MALPELNETDLPKVAAALQRIYLETGHSSQANEDPERLLKTIRLVHEVAFVGLLAIAVETRSQSPIEVGPEASWPDECHPSHVTRHSDASTFDTICVNCHNHDITGGGWGALRLPCPSAHLAQGGPFVGLGQAETILPPGLDALLAPVTKAVPLEWFKVLQAIAQGYKVEVFDDRYIAVQNPDADPKSMALGGVDPYLVIDLESVK